ncbi:MAG: SIS domain-containing protein [Thermoplasmata archaeon]|nr:SIS domain-containing protein [Thermoplasmata archaeon]
MGEERREEREQGGDEVFNIALERLADGIRLIGERVSRETIKQACDLILSSRRIFVYGVGRSGLVGKAFAMRLVQMGLEAYFVGETITPIVEEGDVAVLVSKTGATMSAIQTGNIVRRVGGKVIVVTATPDSKLASTGNVVVVLPPPSGESDDLTPLGTLFEEGAMTVLDAMIAFLMVEKGETEESMRRRHAILV